MTRSHKTDLSLLAVSAVWGSSFTLVKISLDDASPFLFLTIRFFLATLVLIPWALPERRHRPAARMFPGILVGSLLFAGFAFQILGLQFVTPANSAFITGLSVVLVPICLIPMRRRLPNPASLLGVALATLGLFLLLREPGGMQLSRGNLFTLLCAFSFAFHIIGVDHFARRQPYRHFTLIQLSTAGALAGIATLALEEPFIRPSGSLLLALGVTSTLCTAGAYAVQTSMQRFTSPTRVAIIYATEPVFAALFSALFYGERLGGSDILGGGLIFAGMLAAGLRKNSVNPPGCGEASGRPAGHTRRDRC